MQVPLTTPATESTSSPASASSRTRSSGIAPATAASKRSADAPRTRKRLQSRALRRQQILVGGDHVATAIERAFDQLDRIGRAADQFDDEIHLRIVDQRTGVARKDAARQEIGPRLVRIANGDRAQLVADAAAAFDCVALLLQPLGDVRADRSASEQSDPDGHFHCFPSLLMRWESGIKKSALPLCRQGA